MSDFVSGEVTTHRSIRSIVGLNRVAFAGLDRTDERASQHHLTGLDRQPQRRELVGKPGYTGRGMIENTRRKPGLFQLPVTIAKRPDPSQVGFQRPQWTATQYDAGVGCVIGDGIEDLSR